MIFLTEDTLVIITLRFPRLFLSRSAGVVEVARRYCDVRVRTQIRREANAGLVFHAAMYVVAQIEEIKKD